HRQRPCDPSARQPLVGRAEAERLMAGYVALLEAELHFPEAGSLKGKRKHVLSAKSQLQRRFGASVSAGDDPALWQRCAVLPAFTARKAHEAEELAAAAERWLSGQEWELVSTQISVISPDD